MSMNIKHRLTFAVGIFAVLCWVSAAIAGPVKKHNHHSGHALAADKMKQEGNHVLEKRGKHTVSVDIKKGKIAGFHAKHDTKGEVAVKKYKSHKKMAMIDGDASDSVPAQGGTDMGTVWIAYAYVDEDGNEEYYWYPAEEIYDGDTGAVDYIPLS